MINQKDLLSKAIQRICERVHIKNLLEIQRGKNIQVDYIEIICSALLLSPNITITEEYCDKFLYKVKILSDFNKKLTSEEITSQYGIFKYQYWGETNNKSGLSLACGSILIYYRVYYKNNERIVEDDGKVRLFG